MIRSIGVALFTATMFVVATGAADAKSVGVPLGAAPTQTATEVTASNMPTADADLRMWQDDSASGKSVDPVHRFARSVINRTSTIALNLTRSAMRFIGTPYVFGGTTPSGFDCSGYVQYVFAMFGIHLPRTADVQYYTGRHIRGGIRAGDLVLLTFGRNCCNESFCAGRGNMGSGSSRSFWGH